MKSNLFIFTKNSLPYIGYSFVAFILFAILDLELLALMAFIFMLFSAYVFRNPEREYMSLEGDSVISPVDGTIIKVEELHDNKYTYKIVIDSGYLDVSVLRAPLHAKAVSCDIQRGTRVSQKSKLFYDLNENAILELESDTGHEMRIVHRLKRSFAPLMLDITPKDELVKLSRYGVMLCGVTELYLSKDFKADITTGAKVLACETVLGHF